MSWGKICDCPSREHERPAWQPVEGTDPLGLEPGACRKYAEDQQSGGRCPECKEHKA